ncbi:phage protein Gp27 family protein [Zobellella denitrificans]|uniref:phage protein Gp27 family protein n=1 Tax=Zobellella denitrificans TaxID=347534 RepID=UPI001E5E63F7|nr:phage protein Gp27 family protein [Zobellella denitrificans]
MDLLPEPIRRELDAMLRDGRLTQQDILDGINDLIEQHNLPEDMQLSRSGLNRYATRIESIGKDLRELREVSNALVSQLGDKPTGDLSRMILEIGRTQLFKAMMRQAESPNEEVDIGMVKDAMLAPSAWKRRP